MIELSSDWMLKFPTARLHHLLGFSSDHKPIWLVSGDVYSCFYRPQRPFRFEVMWLKDERCEGVVHSAWDMGFAGDPMGNVLLKVSNCQTQLISWNRKVFGNIRRKLDQKRKLLEKAEARSMAGGGKESLKVLNDEIRKLMDLEECMWSQRFKTDWLRYGDQNTKYFHCCTTERNKRNFI